MRQDRSNERADYTGILAVALSLPIYVVALCFVGSEVAKYIGICAAVHIVAIKLNWALRRRFWFWGATAVSFGLHIPLIMRVPLPTHWIPAYSLIPIALADFGIVQGIIVLLEKLMKRRALV